MKLDTGDRHLMRLATRDAGADGWATVSAVVWPKIEKLPDELVERQSTDDGGLVRLTSEGHAVLLYS